MTEVQLVKCIAILNDMELNDYYMSQSIQQINQRISRLGKSNSFAAPVMQAPHSEDYKDYTFAENMHFFRHLRFRRVLFAGMIGFVLSLCFFFAFDNSIQEGGPLYFDWSIENASFEIFWWNNGLIIAGVTLIFFVIGFLIEYLFYAKDKIRGIAQAKQKAKKVAQNNIIRKENYLRAMEEYRENLNNDSIRVQKEEMEKELLQQELISVTQRLQDSRTKKNAFYIQIGIDPGYRYPVPIMYMNEFIRLGIATRLDGADGLYYLVRKELHSDQLYSSLMELNLEMDKVIGNQQTLVSFISDELSQINLQINHMLQKDHEIAASLENLQDHTTYLSRNSEITLYNTKRIAAETEYQSFLQTISI